MNSKDLPYMLYADGAGRVFDHPRYRMVGSSGDSPVILGDDDLIPMPRFSKLFYIPDCPPLGLDPATGKVTAVREVRIDGRRTRCFAVAGFLEPGLVRSHLPAVDYSRKSYTLPMWGYTAVGFKEGRYWAAGFRVEYNHRWDPRNYDDRELVKAIAVFQRSRPCGPLAKHLIRCATDNHCFAAKNLFLKRWEAPLPVSRACNARCLGCLSLQPEGSCDPSHQRISFRPTSEEISSLAVEHLTRAPDAIVSFGQGCEGEPLTEFRLIAESIQVIRDRTDKGTINLNTNGSSPEKVRQLARSGLDSIRISMNSPRPEFYRAYYRPGDYEFEDVVASIALSRELGLHTMINYLVFPGITDQEAELEALRWLISKTGVRFIHLKNLNIDPRRYIEHMPRVSSPTLGMKRMVTLLEKEFPEIEFCYFNRAL